MVVKIFHLAAVESFHDRTFSINHQDCVSSIYWCKTNSSVSFIYFFVYTVISICASSLQDTNPDAERKIVIVHNRVEEVGCFLHITSHDEQNDLENGKQYIHGTVNAA